MNDEDGMPQAFAKLQFEELRKEILGIKERLIRLQLIGVTGIPLVIGAGEKADLTAVLIVSPLVTLVLAFMVIFEQSSLMRAGEYIKDIIEPILAKNSLIGWESWLQLENDRRRAEIFFASSVHIAFAIYFAIGTWLAYGAIEGNLGQLMAVVSLGLYCGGFAIAMYLIVANFRVGTGRARQIIAS